MSAGSPDAGRIEQLDATAVNVDAEAVAARLPPERGLCDPAARLTGEKKWLLENRGLGSFYGRVQVT